MFFVLFACSSNPSSFTADTSSTKATAVVEDLGECTEEMVRLFVEETTNEEAYASGAWHCFPVAPVLHPQTGTEAFDLVTEMGVPVQAEITSASPTLVVEEVGVTVSFTGNEWVDAVMNREDPLKGHGGTYPVDYSTDHLLTSWEEDRGTHSLDMVVEGGSALTGNTALWLEFSVDLTTAMPLPGDGVCYTMSGALWWHDDALGIPSVFTTADPDRETFDPMCYTFP